MRENKIDEEELSSVVVQSALKKVPNERLERMLGKSISQDIVDRFFRERRDSSIYFFQPQRGCSQNS